MLWLIPWAVGTFWLHCLIHEGAHWVAGRAFGLEGQIVLWPGSVDGQWYWARTVWPRGAFVRSQEALVMCAAPVLAELVWLALALAIAIVWPWALLEAGAALVDITQWLLGSDGRQARDLLR